MGVRIAHIGDLHLGRRWLNLSVEGRNLRECDLERAVQAVGAEVVARECDVCVIAGDLFDSTNPTTMARSAAFRLVRDLTAAGVEVIIIGGNHDQARSSTPSPLIHLAEFFACHVALEQGVHERADVRVHLVPFQALADHADGVLLDPLDLAPDRPTIIVAHGAVTLPEIGLPPERVQVPDEVFAAGADAVLLGHIHQHRRCDSLPHTFYCGPVERLNFGERALTPAWWLHEFDDAGTLTSHSVPVPGVRPMRRLQLSGGEGPELVDALRTLLAGEDLEGAVVSLVVQDAPRELRESPWPGQLADQVRAAGAVWCETSLRTAEVDAVLETEINRVPTQLDEALRGFLVERGREDLVSVALEVLEEAGG